MSFTRYGIVTAVDPASITCDLVMTDNGQPMKAVPIATGDLSTNGGTVSLPSVPLPASANDVGKLAQGKNQLVAHCAFDRHGFPSIYGFSHPAGGQMGFKQADRTVHRHAKTGTYWTIAPDGSLEMWHASGAYLRIGTGGHEDLAPLAADGNWKVPATLPTPTFTLQVGGASIGISPGGAVTITAPAGATLVGNLMVDGAIMATGDVTAGQISLKTHPHADVEPGSGERGPPV